MYGGMGKQSKKYSLFVLLLGIFWLGGAFFLASKQDYEQAQNDMLTTVKYVKAQYMEYKKLDTGSEAKSLMLATEKVHQVLLNLQQEKQPLTPELLHSYAKELRLTGIIVLDKDGQPLCESAGDKFSYGSLKKELMKSVVLNIAKEPKKIYIKRVALYDGSFLDIAAHKRHDAEGIVVSYFHTPLNYIKNYNLEMETLLAGYSVESSGTIVISDGFRVVSSNDAELLRKHLRPIELVEQLKERGQKGVLAHLQTGAGAEYYGTLDSGREFYVYVYYPKSKVFATRWQKTGYAAIIYLVVVCLLLLLRRSNEQNFLRKQHELDEEYKKQLWEAARAAERANSAKTEFLQRMSHDIRTPINGVRGMLEIARQSKDNPAKLDECFDKINEASGFLLDLVNEVLDMGKLDAGHIKLEQIPFDLHEVCNEVVALVKKQAAEQDIEIIFEADAVQDLHFIGSPVHIKRILLNILGNAVKYNKPHGKIYLGRTEVERKDDVATVEFVCKDTGLGISKEFLPHIFDQFSQDVHTARSSYEGAGLGMPIVKSLVEKMGGTISVTSEQGEGSTFVVRLPLAVNSEAQVETKVQEAFDPAVVRGMHVLMAEDNALNLEIAQFFLNNAGVTYTAVQDGAQAVQAFRDSAPGEYEAVLLDVMMPVMDGLEATRQIRALEREDAKTVPIIAMTANAFEDDKKRAFDAGMNEHIAKPLQAEILLKTLGKYRKK